MIFQQRAAYKTPRAHPAEVGLLPRVVPHVDLQSWPLPEALGADLANIRFLVGVNPQVCPQQAASTKSSAASVTHVRLFPCVGAHVVLQTVLLGDRLAADITDVTLIAQPVFPHVRSVRRPRVEGRGADFASVLPLLDGRVVGDDVTVEALQGLERLLATVAGEPYLFVDHFAMHVEQFLEEETLPARLASVGVIF